MNGSGFKIVFSVSVSHSFFKNGICSCLSFTAAPATQTIFKRFGFIMRTTANGFELYSNTNGALNILLEQLEKAGHNYFEFGIINSNPTFNLFTDLPIDQPVQLAYSSNASAGAAGEKIQLAPQYLSQDASRVFGKLNIYMDSLKNNGAGTHFTISYSARSTQWQYFIINNSHVSLDNPAIAGEAGINFTGPEQVNLQNGQQALLFTTGSTTLALKETPAYKFDLVSTPVSGAASKKTGPKVIFKGLPNPDPARFGMALVNGANNVSSPMYVYI